MQNVKFNKKAEGCQVSVSIKTFAVLCFRKIYHAPLYICFIYFFIFIPRGTNLY